MHDVFVDDPPLPLSETVISNTTQTQVVVSFIDSHSSCEFSVLFVVGLMRAKKYNISVNLRKMLMCTFFRKFSTEQVNMFDYPSKFVQQRFESNYCDVNKTSYLTVFISTILHEHPAHQTTYLSKVLKYSRLHGSKAIALAFDKSSISS